ncbi:MAG TPA: hypothetical protein VF185_02805 [Patescibacteria group bacterium]
MKGNTRDILIGVVILVIVLGGIYLIRRQKTTPAPLPTPTPISSYEQNLKDQFNITVPDNVQKATLKDVSGGVGEGLATRNYQNSKFTFTALANLEDPVGGSYEVWLERGNPSDANYDIIPVGVARIAKGGYLLDYETSKDLSDHNKVVISLEKVLDTKIEKRILEGSF